MTAQVHDIGAARMSADEIRALAAGAGFPDPDLAAAVALAESGGDPGVVGDLDLGISIGLWQINVKAHPALAAGGELRDPAYNARAAFEVSKGGTNWRPWTTYRSGAYKRFLRSAQKGDGPASNAGPSILVVAFLGWLAWQAFTSPGRGSAKRARSRRTVA
jgi:hypothetical protein